MKKVWCLVVVAALFAACGPRGPVYETTYQFVPPATETGRACVTTCLSSRQTCGQSCAILRGQCKIENREEVRKRYQDYVDERNALGRPLKKTEDDFQYEIFDYGGCGSKEQSCQGSCDANYSQCYTSCGGQVIPQTRCVDNCQAPVPMRGY